MMADTSSKYYACHVRWQQRTGFLLWLDRPEPERESLWADAQNQVPLFETYQHLTSSVLALGEYLQNHEPGLINLDAVAAWLAGSAERPVQECLHVWGLFDDLSAGIQKQFVGNQHDPQRDRVFDLLYVESGPYLDKDVDLPWRLDGHVQWQPADLDTLRRILTQGLELWQQNTYWRQDI